MNICTSDDMHPYECSRPGKCIHCDKKQFEGHDPKQCWLCCDGDPDQQKTTEDVLMEAVSKWNELDYYTTDELRSVFRSIIAEVEKTGKQKGRMEGFAKFADTMTRESAGLLADRLQEANAIRELAYEYGMEAGIEKAVEAMSLELIDYNEKDEREDICPADVRTGYNLAVYKLKAKAEELINDL